MAGEGEGGLTGVLGSCQGLYSVLRREQASGQAGESHAQIYIFNDLPMALHKTCHGLNVSSKVHMLTS